MVYTSSHLAWVLPVMRCSRSVPIVNTDSLVLIVLHMLLIREYASGFWPAFFTSAWLILIWLGSFSSGLVHSHLPCIPSIWPRFFSSDTGPSHLDSAYMYSKTRHADHLHRSIPSIYRPTFHITETKSTVYFPCFEKFRKLTTSLTGPHEITPANDRLREVLLYNDIFTGTIYKRSRYITWSLCRGWNAIDLFW